MFCPSSEFTLQTVKTVILEEVAGVKRCVLGSNSCRRPRRDQKLLFNWTHPGGLVKFAAAFAVLNLQRPTVPQRLATHIASPNVKTGVFKTRLNRGIATVAST